MSNVYIIIIIIISINNLAVSTCYLVEGVAGKTPGSKDREEGVGRACKEEMMGGFLDQVPEEATGSKDWEQGVGGVRYLYKGSEEEEEVEEGVVGLNRTSEEVGCEYVTRV